jgi:sulfite exporter TauE/SafE
MIPITQTADPLVLITALALGVGSSLHCLAMCGPLAAAVPLAPGAARWPRLIAYNAGRLVSYATGGVLAAGLGGALLLAGGGAARSALTLLAACFVVATVAGQAGWLPALQTLERQGRRLWARIAPVGRGAGARGGLAGVFLLGLLWGWLPCGMVYAALALATATADPLRGAAVMLCFGLGTLPSMLGAGWLAGRIVGSPAGSGARRLREAMAAVIIALTVWSTVTALGPHAGHAHAAPPAADADCGRTAH